MKQRVNIKKLKCRLHPGLETMSRYRRGIPLDKDGTCEICKSKEGNKIIIRIAGMRKVAMSLLRD